VTSRRSRRTSSAALCRTDRRTFQSTGHEAREGAGNRDDHRESRPPHEEPNGTAGQARQALGRGSREGGGEGRQGRAKSTRSGSPHEPQPRAGEGQICPDEESPNVLQEPSTEAPDPTPPEGHTPVERRHRPASSHTAARRQASSRSAHRIGLDYGREGRRGTTGWARAVGFCDRRPPLARGLSCSRCGTGVPPISTSPRSLEP
jgi:hypothetical protein